MILNSSLEHNVAHKLKDPDRGRAFLNGVVVRLVRESNFLLLNYASSI